jgi:hypothetical protein
MLQPATLRQESSGGQQNSTYFVGDALQLVLMLQLQLLVLKPVILFLYIHN